MAAFDTAAKLSHHGLLAVADAKHRQPAVEHPVRCARRAEFRYARRPAGQDHRLRLQPLHGVFGAVERYNLGVDALLAYPPGDQLCHLTAEVDDENGVGHGPARRFENRLHHPPPIDHRF